MIMEFTTYPWTKSTQKRCFQSTQPEILLHTNSADKLSDNSESMKTVPYKIKIVGIYSKHKLYTVKTAKRKLTDI